MHRSDGSAIHIANRLKAMGITAQYVNTVKFNIKKKSGQAAVKKIAEKSDNKVEAAYTLSELLKARKLAEEVTGVDKAQELLNTLSKLG